MPAAVHKVAQVGIGFDSAEHGQANGMDQGLEAIRAAFERVDHGNLFP
jgi:hypothetical protein